MLAHKSIDNMLMPKAAKCIKALEAGIPLTLEHFCSHLVGSEQAGRKGGVEDVENQCKILIIGYSMMNTELVKSRIRSNHHSADYTDLTWLASRCMLGTSTGESTTLVSHGIA